MERFHSLQRRKNPLPVREFLNIFDSVRTKKEKNVYGPNIWIYMYISCCHENDIDTFRRLTDVLLLDGYDINMLSHKYGYNVFHLCLIDFLFSKTSTFARLALCHLLLSGVSIHAPCLYVHKTGVFEPMNLVKSFDSLTRSDCDRFFERLTAKTLHWDTRHNPSSVQFINDMTIIFDMKDIDHPKIDPFLRDLVVSFLSTEYQLNPFQSYEMITKHIEWIKTQNMTEMKVKLNDRRKELYFPKDYPYSILNVEMDIDDKNVLFPYEYLPVRFDDEKRTWFYHRAMIPYMLRCGVFPMPHHVITKDIREKMLLSYRTFPYSLLTDSPEDMNKQKIIADVVSTVMASFHPYTVVRALFSVNWYVIKYTCKKLQDKPSFLKAFGKVRTIDEFYDECFRHIHTFNNIDRMNFVMENVMLDYHLFQRLLSMDCEIYSKPVSVVYAEYPIVYDMLHERIQFSHQDNTYYRGDYDTYAWGNIQLLYRYYVDEKKNEDKF